MTYFLQADGEIVCTPFRHMPNLLMAFSDGPRPRGQELTARAAPMHKLLAEGLFFRVSCQLPEKKKNSPRRKRVRSVVELNFFQKADSKFSNWADIIAWDPKAAFKPTPQVLQIRR